MADSPKKKRTDTHAEAGQPAAVTPSENNLDHWLEQEIAALQANHLQRTLTETAALTELRVRRNGRVLVNFSGNDYLGLSHNPEVIAAAGAALVDFGAGSGASRLVTGNHPLYAELEAALAIFKQKEAALVFGSGYLTNLGVIESLAGRRDLIIADKFSHACMVDGARLSGAAFMRYSHNDLEHLEQLLKTHRPHHRHAWVMTEGVFSMDGDRAPITALRALCEAYGAWLILDEAHSAGLLGEEYESEARQADLRIGTLSKTLGSYGGYVAASHAVIRYLTSTTRSLLFSTGLPPSAVAAARKSLEILQREPELRDRPLQLARRFTARLGLAEAQSPIVPFHVGNSASALHLASELEREGMLVVAIRPPTVPEGTARLRATFSAMHTEDEVEKLAFLLHSLTYRS